VAAPEDVAAIEALVRQAFERYVELLGRHPRPMEDDHAAHVAGGLAWVLEQDGQPAGTVAVQDHGDHVYVDDLAVDPRRQGHGLGGALLAFAERRAWALGRTELRLDTNVVMEDNQRMYAHLGWRAVLRDEERGRIRYVKAVPELRDRDLERAACTLLAGGGAWPSAPVAAGSERWTAVAVDVEPGGRAGTVVYLRAGLAVAVLSAGVRGEWQELLVEDHPWPADPSARPDGAGFLWPPVTFGAGLRGDPDRVVAATAGVVGSTVDRLEVTADDETRPVAFSPHTGAFAVAAPCRPQAAFELVALAGGDEVARCSYRAPD
jgi:GNAT superfamily N-acetyltransferase